MVDASGDEVAADPKALGAVESGHTMVLDREALLKDRPRAPGGKRFLESVFRIIRDVRDLDRSPLKDHATHHRAAAGA